MSDLIKLQKVAASRSLLYIDGDKQLQKNYGIYFQKSFKNLYQAYDGEEGFEKFKKYNPDVVILDLKLDKKDAIDLISEMNDIKDDVILISLSGTCENYNLLQTLDMGLAKMLLKPVGFAKIAHVLLSLLPPPPKEKSIKKVPIKEVQQPKVKQEFPVKQEIPKKQELSVKPQLPEKKKEPTVKKVEQKKQITKEPPKEEKTAPKVEIKKEVVEKPPVKIKSEAEISFDLIQELSNKKTLVEFINSYKGIMILHDGVVGEVQGNSFIVKVNIAQILAAKSEKQILIKTPDHRYINALIKGIDLKTTSLELVNPRILQYKQRDKEYARILADKSFRASIYFHKKLVDFEVSYISFKSAVLICEKQNSDFKVGDTMDITLGFDISGPNAMIRDKKFTKMFAKCEVIRIDEKRDFKKVVVLLEVNKSGERTLKKYLNERESELIYEFKSRVRR